MKKSRLIKCLLVIAALVLISVFLISCNENEEQASDEPTVQFDANGGSFDDYSYIVTRQVQRGSKIVEPSRPTRSNHTFMGWALGRTSSTLWDFDTDVVTEDIILYALWTEDSVVISSVDGASMDGNSIYMFVESDVSSVALSDKVVCSDDAYWNLYYDEAGSRYVSNNVAAQKNGRLDNGENIFYILVFPNDGELFNVYQLTIYRSYSVEVNYYDGDNVIYTDSCYTGHEYMASYEPTIKGYTFNYWEKDNVAYSTQTVWEELDLVANKTANKYTVTFDVNQGDDLDEAIRSQEVTYGSQFSFPVPTRTGYRFVGWCDEYNTQVTNSNGIDLWADNGWSIDRNVCLTAHWEANRYELTLVVSKDDAGTVSGAGKHWYDDKVKLTASTNAGYTFVGWFDEEELLSNELVYTYTMGLDNTITAKWIKVTILRSSEMAGSVTELTGRYIAGDKVTVTATTTHSEFSFVGWYEDGVQQVATEEFEFVMPDVDTTYIATWHAREYNISYNYSDVGEFEGDFPTSYTVEGVELPRLISKEGTEHHFLYWRADDGAIYETAIPQGITGDMELTAIWWGNHSFDDKYTCTICGQLKELYYSEVAGEVKPYTLRDNTVVFGSYPQSEVEDTALQSMLNAEIQNKLPSGDNANGWTDYGYYIGGTVQSYMWYIDVEYQGTKYRGVYFTSYRPEDTTYSSPNSNYQYSNGYKTNIVYWFKWEPITWRILSQSEDKVLLLANFIVDNQQYYHEYTGTRTINGKTVYPSNYKESDIRKWLNNDFYNAAFDEFGKQFIVKTEVNNSASTTDGAETKHICENTFDNLFLLSYKDTINTNYGFSGDRQAEGGARQLMTTAYARCQGAHINYNSWGFSGFWMLRSPAYFFSNEVESVSLMGDSGGGCIVSEPTGVVPALQIML